MRAVIIVLALLCSVIRPAAAVPTWVQHAGGAGGDIAAAVSSGASGVFAGGFFSGTVDFGGGNITAPGQGTDIVVVRYRDSDGSWQWNAHTGNLGSNSVLGVALDSVPNVFVTGFFQNTIQLAGCAPLTTALGGESDIFVAKLDGGTGACLWSNSYGAGGDDIGYGIAVDPTTGDVVVTGVFVGHINFGGSTLISSNNGSGNSTFIAKFTNSAGAHVWSTAFSQTQSLNGPDEGRAITVDADGNVVVTGAFQGTEYFNQVTPIVSSGLGPDIYLIKLNGSGVYQWVDTFGGGGTDIGLGVATDIARNIYLGGQFAASVNFGGGTVTSLGPQSGVIASYTSAGTWRWQRIVTSTSAVDVVNAVTIPRNGEVVASGVFAGSVDFGAGPVGAAGPGDIFLAKYATADGSYMVAKSFPGNQIDRGLAVSGDPFGAVLNAGAFDGTIDFGLGPVVSQGNADWYVLRDVLPTPAPTPGTRTVTLDTVTVSTTTPTFNAWISINEGLGLDGFVYHYVYDPALIRPTTISLQSAWVIAGCTASRDFSTLGLVQITITCTAPLATSLSGNQVATVFSVQGPAGISPLQWTLCTLDPSAPCTTVNGSVALIAPTPTNTPITPGTATQTPTINITQTPTTIPSSTNTRTPTITPTRTNTPAMTLTWTPTRTFTSTPTPIPTTWCCQIGNLCGNGVSCPAFETVPNAVCQVESTSFAGCHTVTPTITVSPTVTMTATGPSPTGATRTSTPTRTLTATPLNTPPLVLDAVVQRNPPTPTNTMVPGSTRTFTPTWTPTRTPSVISTATKTFTWTPRPTPPQFDVVQQPNPQTPTWTPSGTPTADTPTQTPTATGPTPTPPFIPGDAVIQPNPPTRSPTPNVTMTPHAPIFDDVRQPNPITPGNTPTITPTPPPPNNFDQVMQPNFPGGTMTPTISPTPTATFQFVCVPNTPTATPTSTPACPFTFRDDTADAGHTCLFLGGYNDTCGSRAPLYAVFFGNGNALDVVWGTQPTLRVGGAQPGGTVVSPTQAEMTLWGMGTSAVLPMSDTMTLENNGGILRMTLHEPTQVAICAVPGGCTTSERCPMEYYEGVFVKVIDQLNPPVDTNLSPVPEAP